MSFRLPHELTFFLFAFFSSDRKISSLSRILNFREKLKKEDKGQKRFRYLEEYLPHRVCSSRGYSEEDLRSERSSISLQ